MSLATSVRGATTHNLKHVSLELRPFELVVLTGPSGSGKSSLAMDTLYAEGQRRFVESFSPYARQFLERLDRPPAESIEPVAAGIAVDRKAPIKSSRSTVATMAELEPYLAAWFGLDAVPMCPTCQVEAVVVDAHSVAESLSTKPDRRAIVTYPVLAESPERYIELRETLAKDGFRRIVVGEHVRLIEDIKPSDVEGQTLEVVLDRLTTADTSRVREAMEQAFFRSKVAHLRLDGKEPSCLKFARGLSCPTCARLFESARSGLFSYNTPAGACPSCKGFGRVIGIDWSKVIPDPSLSLAKGVLKAWMGKSAEWERGELKKLCQRRAISETAPWNSLSALHQSLILDGEPIKAGAAKGRFHGVKAWFQWLEQRTYKMHVRVFLSRYRSYDPCPSCSGSRLNDEARSYRIAGLSLPAFHGLSVAQALKVVENYSFARPTCGGSVNSRESVTSVSTRDVEATKSARVREALQTRLGYLNRVGLGHLQLDRPARTLSGGEAQRVALTTALGTSLSGALFVVDEPTAGLHEEDIPPLIEALHTLAAAGNAVVVIEHDPSVLRAADRVVVLGPAAGPDGGKILFDGTPSELALRRQLPSGRVIARDRSTAPVSRGRKHRDSLTIAAAGGHNLKNVDVEIPRGVLVAITGPSGSGKSSLAHGVLARGLAKQLGQAVEEAPLPCGGFGGIQGITHVHHVDQAPLGRTSRGNAATYTKAWDHVRELYAKVSMGDRPPLPPAHFSFNTAGGRCETCSGEGFETVEMQFLSDVAIRCPVCQGRRFGHEVLAITIDGKNVADLLAMTVTEVKEFAARQLQSSAKASRWTKLAGALDAVQAVGLGYLPIGQPLSTLSGGEAQRLKLARTLVEVRDELAVGSLVVVDEPSAGLSAEDMSSVISALQALVDRGASVLVVEHDLDLIAAADHVIDLGPAGGENGGRIVATGSPSHLAMCDTATGRALARHLGLVDVMEQQVAREPVISHPLTLSVRHAREHNLKDVSIDLPHGQLIVFTGPSGSGKSTLAFDVIFAEGQRRFLETLSPYARQFLPTLPRPDVESVSSVPPSIALEQRTSRGGSTSTVGTVTEVGHYLRLLYAKVGTPYCPTCDVPIEPMDHATIVAKIQKLTGKRILLAPAVKARKGTHLDVFTVATRAGIKEAVVDGLRVSIDPPPKLAKTKEHTIELLLAEGDPKKFAELTIRQALDRGDGEVVVETARKAAADSAERLALSSKRACPLCGKGVPELDPRWFSFNTVQGQCPGCEGKGAVIDEEDPDARPEPCRVCQGSRLATIPGRVRLDGETYPALMRKSVDRAIVRLPSLERTLRQDAVKWQLSEASITELQRRLRFLAEVGLGYLALDRAANTLSGGEMQRLRLAAQLGSGLTGALYVLDEPTIGLHPRDTNRLLTNLRALVDTGSTVLVVEHDESVIRAADFLVDLGPVGGREGGHVVAAGSPTGVLAHPDSTTAKALARAGLLAPQVRVPATGWIELDEARGHNLAGVKLSVPVGRLTVIAGVSGSGKSTLVREIFHPAVRKALGLATREPLPFGKLRGVEQVERALAIDQAPIGRTSRSTPATFLGIFDHIRKLFSQTKDAQTRGFAPGRFSFNGAEGRCPACSGMGVIVSEMSFLPDVTSPCEQCLGLRYEPGTLEVRFRGRNIGEVLATTARDAAELFSAHPKIERPLRILDDLGVGYLSLGQGSHTLSGGEAQRLKLAAELAPGSQHKPTLYVLDEPTTGLHLSDVEKLVSVLFRLVDRGDTLVVVEHHPDVIAAADWVVELGPEGGELGGRIVAQGTARELEQAQTATGSVLRERRERHEAAALHSVAIP